jgi:PilZ domain
MQERRNKSRGRSFLGAKIIFNNRSSTIDCLIKDMSPTGARVRLSAIVIVPDEFELHIPMQGRSFQARVAWRRREEFGLEFVKCGEQDHPVSLDLTLRLNKLEKEKEALRARVAQLSSAE